MKFQCQGQIARNLRLSNNIKLCIKIAEEEKTAENSSKQPGLGGGKEKSKEGIVFHN